MRDIILTSSVLIAVTALLRRLLRGKISPRLQYGLWLLAALRLLLPGALFTVPVSVTGAASGLTAVMQERVPAPLPDNLAPALPLPDQPESTPPQNTTQVRPAVDWLDFVWKAGILVTGCAMALSNLIFYLQLRSKRQPIPLPPGSETGRLPVYLVEDLPSPCLFGLYCPAIYLNSRALDPAHLPYVLTHERTHFRHGDHLWSILRGVCLAVHWYNPLVWLAASLSRRDCELACDDGAIWVLGEGQRLEYGNALVQMIVPSRTSLLRASTSMTAGKRNMKERIALIVQRPRMLKATAVLTLLVMCSAVAVTFGAQAAALTENPPEPPPEEEEASQPLARYLAQPASPDYTHFSGLFSLTLPEDMLDSLLLAEDEDGVYFYDAAAYREAPEDSLLLRVYPQAEAWASAYEAEQWTLGRFDTNGSPYVYLLDWNRTAAFSQRAQVLRDAAADSFQLYASADLFSRLVRSFYGDNMPMAAAYLPYLSWDNYRTVYDENEMSGALSALWSFAASGALEWGQYHDLMSSRTDSAIDGAYATAYQDMIWELYHQNPSQFASVLKSPYLTGAERDHILFWFRGAVASHQDWPEALTFSDEVLYQLLGITELNSVG